MLKSRPQSNGRILKYRGRNRSDKMNKRHRINYLAWNQKVQDAGTLLSTKEAIRPAAVSNSTRSVLMTRW